LGTARKIVVGREGEGGGGRGGERRREEEGAKRCDAGGGTGEEARDHKHKKAGSTFCSAENLLSTIKKVLNQNWNILSLDRPRWVNSIYSKDTNTTFASVGAQHSHYKRWKWQQ